MENTASPLPIPARADIDRRTHYEVEFARFLGSPLPAFAFYKGRVALYAVLKVLGIGPGDEVLLPAFTCVAVPNAVRLAGAVPVYVDIPPDSYNLDVESVRARITPRTRALIVQHTFGIPALIDRFASLSSVAGLPLIEDCAHALGTFYRGRHLGLWGKAAFFSSGWSKPYTTGLGGLAVSSDPEFTRRLARVFPAFTAPPRLALLRLRLQHRLYHAFFTPRLYWTAQDLLRLLSRAGLFVGSSAEAGLAGELPTDHGWRMGSCQQKLGLRQLARQGRSIPRRAALTSYYDRLLQGAGWQPLERPQGAVLLRYPVRVANKLELLADARRARLELGSWFETPLHPVPLDRGPVFGYAPGSCPNAERAARQVVNLPLHDRVTNAGAARILEFFLDRALPPAA